MSDWADFKARQIGRLFTGLDEGGDPLSPSRWFPLPGAKGGEE